FRRFGSQRAYVLLWYSLQLTLVLPQFGPVLDLSTDLATPGGKYGPENTYPLPNKHPETALFLKRGGKNADMRFRRRKHSPGGQPGAVERNERDESRMAT